MAQNFCVINHAYYRCASRFFARQLPGVSKPSSECHVLCMRVVSEDQSGY